MMNTLGVVLSASCLAAALIELRMRADVAGRRMGAMLAAAAWATMGFVALDQSRQCQALMQSPQQSGHQTQVAVPARQIVADALRDQWQYTAPDGGEVTYQAGAKPAAQLVGADQWQRQPGEHF